MLGWIIGWLKYGSAAAEMREKKKNQAMRRADAEASNAALRADVEPKVRRRFEGRVFFVPDEVRNLKHLKHLKEQLRDDLWKRWNVILLSFPTEPQNQIEAQRNERAFWRAWMKKFTKTDEYGQRLLAKHADIHHFYQQNERWILRDYFAATGKVLDPAVKEFCRLQLERHKITQWSWLDDKKIAKQERELERLDQELRHWQHQTMKSHFDRWEVWFSAHVEDAFNQDNEPKQQSTDNVHGEGGFANAADIKSMRSSARTPFRRPAAHEQEFDE